jgi:glucosamine--fructose-6-phosphate aminotransferase (isomerizing)
MSMCGIVGYIGPKDAVPILMEGLARLEYRGYDSAGIAVLKGGQVAVRKAKGRLSQLAELLSDKPASGNVGIGHTRWATHGEPSDMNAHPHTDVKGHIAVVHNGIIENHETLRRFLQSTGCRFVSQTDTEVIAHLLNHLYEGDMLKAIAQAIGMLEGSFALAIVTQTEPDALFCVRKDSPLVVGMGQGEQFIASDIPAIINYTRDVVLLEDKEIAILRRDGISLYDPYGRSKEFVPFHVDWDVSAAEKGGYAHFMLKEISEEPEALQKTLSAHVDTAAGNIRENSFPMTDKEARDLKKLTIVACGTAYHASVLGKYLIERLARLPVDVDIASEFRYRDPIIKPGEAFLAVSQSGETADTLAALREARKRDAKVMALTNVVGSSIAREAGEGHVLYTWAGPEIAVASTKAYITQVEMLALLAIDLAKKRNAIADTLYTQLLSGLAALPQAAVKALENRESIQRFADRNKDQKHVFFIGRGLDYALAMEASLKLKEVSYIFSEAYAAGELKHGTIALIEPGTLVVAILTQQSLADKTLSNVREVKARGARVLMVAPESLAEKARPEADELWLVPDVYELFLPLLTIIPLQLLAYHMAVERGCDVDKPRNLAKSVTVE